MSNGNGNGNGNGESRDERLNRELIELLNELRDVTLADAVLERADFTDAHVVLDE